MPLPQTPLTEAQGGRSPLFFYLLLPLGVQALLVGLFFSGNRTLAELVAPVANREYGLLENLQNLVLLAMVVSAFKAMGEEVHKGIRLLWGGLGLFAILILLEEVDFGLHYYESLRGIVPEEKAAIRNLHNQRGVLDVIKLVVDVGFVLLYVVAPWLAKRFPSSVAVLIPDRRSILVLLVAVAASRAAHWLEDNASTDFGALKGNISEFRELGTYWVALLHVRTVKRRRASASSTEPHAGV